MLEERKIFNDIFSNVVFIASYTTIIIIFEKINKDKIVRTASDTSFLL